jgi:hypothetical protein
MTQPAAKTNNDDGGFGDFDAAPSDFDAALSDFDAAPSVPEPEPAQVADDDNFGDFGEAPLMVQPAKTNDDDFRDLQSLRL